MEKLKVASLVSGGKDSVYAMNWAKENDHEVKYIVYFKSRNPDSYMFHTVTSGVVPLISQKTGIPFIEIETEGEKEKELLDMEKALKELDIDAITTGAVRSNYQKERIDKICKKLGLKNLSPLWHCDEEKYLLEIAEKFEVIITKVSADGLGEEQLGKKIDKEMIEELKKIREKTGISIVGEGGEFETLTLNAPIYREKIKIEFEKKMEGNTGKVIVTRAE